MIKVAHFYWGGGPLSYLRYLTIKSFQKYNPDWEVQLHVPVTGVMVQNTWGTGEQPEPYFGEDYTNKLEHLFVVHDFENLGFLNLIPETYKSDFLRWHLLSTEGGLWLDMDILFFRPVPPIERNCITACFPVYYICFVYSEKTEFFKEIREHALNIDFSDYQSIGSHLFYKLYQGHIGIDLINPVIVLPVTRLNKLHVIFDSCRNLDLTDSIGLHWFGGHKLGREWENRITESNWDTYDNILCEVIKEIHDVQSRSLLHI